MDTERSLFRTALLSAAAIITMNTIGSYVSKMGAGMACPEWPLCPWPETLPILLEFIHRVWGLVVVGAVVYTAYVARRLAGHGFSRAVRGLAYLSLLLVAIQVGMGAVVVFSYLLPENVALHQLLAQVLLSLQAVIAGAAWARSAS
jgi:heme A synthase